MGKIDDLMKDWRAAYNDLLDSTADLNDQLNVLKDEMLAISTPYMERMHEIEEEIKAIAIVHASSTKAHGVAVNYRKGYERVSYDSGKTDTVLGILRDVLPETAKSLEGARKSSWVKPSVSVKAVD